MTEQRCRDCGVLEGGIHRLGCGRERCPFCGWQLISCDCVYEQLRLRNMTTYGRDTAYLPPKIYTQGLSRRQHAAWQRLLEGKGRVPYIVYPVLCARCGVLWPDLFAVPQDEWEHYIEIGEREKVVCRPCYDTIKRLIDRA